MSRRIVTNSVRVCEGSVLVRSSDSLQRERERENIQDRRTLWNITNSHVQNDVNGKKAETEDVTHRLAGNGLINGSIIGHCAWPTDPVDLLWYRTVPTSINNTQLSGSCHSDCHATLTQPSTVTTVALTTVDSSDCQAATCSTSTSTSRPRPDQITDHRRDHAVLLCWRVCVLESCSTFTQTDRQTDRQVAEAGAGWLDQMRQLKVGFHYPSSRPELTTRELGCIFDTRQLG